MPAFLWRFKMNRPQSPHYTQSPEVPLTDPPRRVLTGFLPLGLSPNNDVHNVRGSLPFPVCLTESSGVRVPRPGPAR